MIKTLFPVSLPCDIVDDILEMAWNNCCYDSSLDFKCSNCGQEAHFHFYASFNGRMLGGWSLCGEHVKDFPIDSNDGFRDHRRCWKRRRFDG